MSRSFNDRILEYFYNENCADGQQEITSIIVGVITAPFGDGLFLLFVWIVFYEIFYYLLTRANPRCYRPFTRISIVLCSLFGWLVGRELMSKPSAHWGKHCPYIKDGVTICSSTEKPISIRNLFGYPL